MTSHKASLSRKEFYFRGYQDVKLYAQLWPNTNIEATTAATETLIITHGQGEHGESYKRVVEALQSLPLQIVTWDLRGHGRSEGLRGVVDQFQEYCEDLRALIQHLETEYQISRQPIKLLGHSMGGLVQTRSLLSFKDLPEIHSQVLSGPLFGLTKPVPAFKQWGSIAMKIFTPKVTTWNEITNDDCSRDQTVIEEFKTDIYRHDRISSGAFLGFYESWRKVFQGVQDIKIPTLMQISDVDPVISSEKAQEFFQALQCEKVLKIYPNRRHEIYNDLDRETVLADLAGFLGK